MKGRCLEKQISKKITFTRIYKEHEKDFTPKAADWQKRNFVIKTPRIFHYEKKQRFFTSFNKINCSNVTQKFNHELREHKLGINVEPAAKEVDIMKKKIRNCKMLIEDNITYSDVYKTITNIWSGNDTISS